MWERVNSNQCSEKGRRESGASPSTRGQRTTVGRGPNGGRQRGVCLITFQPGHRAVHLSCANGRRVLFVHARLFGGRPRVGRGASTAPLSNSQVVAFDKPDGTHWRRRFKQIRLFAIGPRHRRRQLEEVSREVQQFGVALHRLLEHVGMKTRTLHGTGNWFMLMNCSSAFNTVSMTGGLAEVATCVPMNTPLGAMCYHERPADALFRVFLGEHRTLAILCSERGPYETADVLVVVAEAAAEAFPGGNRGARSRRLRLHGRRWSCSHGGYGKHGVRAMPFLRREVDAMGIVANPAKTVVSCHGRDAQELFPISSLEILSIKINISC